MTVISSIVTIYIYEGKAYLPTLARFPMGGFIEIEPVVVSEISLDELSTAIKTMLDRGQAEVIPSQLQNVGRNRGVILRATGVSSWRKLVHLGALSYSIDFDHADIRIARSESDGKGNWYPVAGNELILHPETSLEAIANIILDDIRDRL